MDKTKVLLFAMTGFGNNALKVLISQPFIKVIGVFTPKRQETPFPYYECEKLHDLVVNDGIALYEGLILRKESTYQLIKTLSPGLIVVSSFDQIIPETIISIPRLGVVNVHPSLLPKYRGRTPTVWALTNGEEETGVTVHFIEDKKIDRGRIIEQARLKIEPSDTDGTLRLKLAKLSEGVLAEALSLILIRGKETFPLQNESEATYYPKRTLNDAEINLGRPFRDIVNKIRAMSPYPGAYLRYNGKKYVVTGATLLNAKNPKDISKMEEEKLLVNTSEGIIKFQLIRN